MTTFILAAFIVLIVGTALYDAKRIRESNREMSRWLDKKEAHRQGTADVIPFRNRELSLSRRRALRQKVASINPRRGGEAA